MSHHTTTNLIIEQCHPELPAKRNPTVVPFGSEAEALAFARKYGANYVKDLPKRVQPKGFGIVTKSTSNIAEWKFELNDDGDYLWLVVKGHSPDLAVVPKGYIAR